MAYIDLDFYKNEYHGNVVPDSDFDRLADKATDAVDAMTFDRLVDWMPDGAREQKKIKKAVCAVMDRLYEIDLAEKQGRNAIAGGSSSSDSGGTNSGAIVSRSAGSESISYASPSQMASGAKEWSAVYAAAGNAQETYKVLYSAASLYLMGIRDRNGVPLLYAGVG